MADGGASPLHRAHDLLLFDLDGVVYVGAGAVPGAVAAITTLTAAGVAVGYATNNASRPPAEVADHLRRLGIDAADAQVTTSSQAAAQIVRSELGAGARVLPIGGPGVREALLEADLVPVGVADDPAAVVQGFGREVGWSDLADAAAAIRSGALWVATNTDLTLPTERGPAPGNGSLVGAVRNAVGIDPLVAGKPEPILFTAAAQRAGARSPLVIGDRLDTDIAGGRRAGMATLLVLTGLTSPAALVAAEAVERPDHVSADLGGLLEPAAHVERTPDGWRCGAALAGVDGQRLRWHWAATGPQQAGTAHLVDLLRVVCAAVWEGDGAAPPADDDLTSCWEELTARCTRQRPDAAVSGGR